MRRIPIIPPSHVLAQPERSGTFITINKPTLTNHHPKFMVYVRVRFRCCHSAGFDKCVMPFVHHCGITHNGFTALPPLGSACSSVTPPTPGNHGSSHCLQSFDFPECDTVGTMPEISLFSLASFHLVTCTQALS